MPERTLCTKPAAAKRLGVTVRTIDNYIGAGLLAAYRLPGGQMRLELAEVDSLLEPVDPAEVSSTYDDRDSPKVPRPKNPRPRRTSAPLVGGA